MCNWLSSISVTLSNLFGVGYFYIIELFQKIAQKATLSSLKVIKLYDIENLVI